MSCRRGTTRRALTKNADTSYTVCTVDITAVAISPPTTKIELPIKTAEAAAT
ncbi:hypothetical protein H206_05570 [Candidatus Electrothrix aarhusensis]|uniref:Uncharacterized protein n=1 Tax=Candidatus Electrothrix aarhusensis TaxID=1859131 RepID=A0A444J444_9BACT|nr:hypothetical protein H206_05570 [Candidatus Electrothrix aarhusensis]